MTTDRKPAPNVTRPLRLVKETVRNLTAQPTGAQQLGSKDKSTCLCSFFGCIS
jgi:hypothetical protein